MMFCKVKFFMKIRVVNTATGFVPETDEDHELKRKMKIGSTYEAVFSEVRNPKVHRLYFALINCSWEYLTEQQREFFKEDVVLFRKTVQVAAGHYEPCYSIARREWIEVPKSIAFDRLSESDFSKLYERVRDVIYTTFIPNINKKAFEEQLKYF